MPTPAKPAIFAPNFSQVLLLCLSFFNAIARTASLPRQNGACLQPRIDLKATSAEQCLKRLEPASGCGVPKISKIVVGLDGRCITKKCASKKWLSTSVIFFHSFLTVLLEPRWLKIYTPMSIAIKESIIFRHNLVAPFPPVPFTLGTSHLISKVCSSSHRRPQLPGHLLRRTKSPSVKPTVQNLRYETFQGDFCVQKFEVVNRVSPNFVRRILIHQFEAHLTAPQHQEPHFGYLWV